MTEKGNGEEFRVFLAEDGKDWARTIRAIIEELGGILIETATTLEDALEVVLKLGELEIDLVILGGSRGNYEPLDILLAIVAEKAHNPEIENVKTISFSGDVKGDFLQHVDKEIFRWRPDELIAAIIGLMTQTEELEEV